MYKRQALNKTADHRLDGAMAGGYADDRIPGEGTINDYLSLINYRRNASCLELYVQNILRRVRNKTIKME